jgi:hypothetical protein
LAVSSSKRAVAAEKRTGSELLPSQLSEFSDFYVSLLVRVMVVMMAMMPVIATMPAVPVVRRPIIVAIVRIRSVIAIRIIPVIARIAIIASNPNSDRNLSVGTWR